MLDHSRTLPFVFDRPASGRTLSTVREACAAAQDLQATIDDARRCSFYGVSDRMRRLSVAATDAMRIIDRRGSATSTDNSSCSGSVTAPDAARPDTAPQPETLRPPAVGRPSLSEGTTPLGLSTAERERRLSAFVLNVEAAQREVDHRRCIDVSGDVSPAEASLSPSPPPSTIVVEAHGSLADPAAHAPTPSTPRVAVVAPIDVPTPPVAPMTSRGPRRPSAFRGPPLPESLGDSIPPPPRLRGVPYHTAARPRRRSSFTLPEVPPQTARVRPSELVARAGPDPRCSPASLPKSFAPSFDRNGALCARPLPSQKLPPGSLSGTEHLHSHAACREAAKYRRGMTNPEPRRLNLGSSSAV